MLGKTRHVHFVGIGGIGMSGIAELLVNLGYRVSGSDTKPSAVTARLASLGVTVHEGHRAGHVEGADVVVYSSAVRNDNPELTAARARRVPAIPRAEMLAELMRLRSGIAVAGAHGKTSTTSMVALVLERAGLDPTAVIGGRLSAFGSNARLGRGEWMVVEADESDRSFLKLTPTIAVVTNIDREHMETYGTFDELAAAFADFANMVPFYGAVIACVDDEHVRAIRHRLARRVIGYGIDAADADLAAVDVELSGFGARCRVVRRMVGETSATTELGTLVLKVPGRHSVLNALAAVAVGLELDVPFAAIAAALGEFQGAERRFQHVGERGGIRVVDDYGHHPTEIRAVLTAARAAAPARIVVAFQPHRYTRTRDLLAEFGEALALADQIVVTDIYAAGEAPIDGIDAAALVASIDRQRPGVTRLVPAVDDVPGALLGTTRPGDLVITLGAGSIGSVAGKFVAALEARERREL